MMIDNIYREAEGDTEKRKVIQRSRRGYREAEWDTEKQNGIQRSRMGYREAEGDL
jgi:hypothetical protein